MLKWRPWKHDGNDPTTAPWVRDSLRAKPKPLGNGFFLYPIFLDGPREANQFLVCVTFKDDRFVFLEGKILTATSGTTFLKLKDLESLMTYLAGGDFIREVVSGGKGKRGRGTTGRSAKRTHTVLFFSFVC